jgi:hypothetical protein
MWRGDRLRQRLRRSRRLLPVAGAGHRTVGWLHFPGRRHAGVSEPEGLRRIRQCKSASGLEPLADVQSVAHGGNAAHALKAHVHEIEAQVLTHCCGELSAYIISLRPCAKFVGEASQFAVIRDQAREPLSVFEGGADISGIAAERHESQ